MSIIPIINIKDDKGVIDKKLDSTTFGSQGKSAAAELGALGGGGV